MNYLTDSRGTVITNILEVSEGWCWAMLYQRQSRRNKGAMPSQVPPDWINSMKDLGWKCHELLTEGSNAKD